jgi:hypothetical protein
MYMHKISWNDSEKVEQERNSLLALAFKMLHATSIKSVTLSTM